MRNREQLPTPSMNPLDRYEDRDRLKPNVALCRAWPMLDRDVFLNISTLFCVIKMTVFEHTVLVEKLDRNCGLFYRTSTFNSFRQISSVCYHDRFAGNMSRFTKGLLKPSASLLCSAAVIARHDRLIGRTFGHS